MTDKSSAGVSIGPWTPGPRYPRLGPNGVDVWRVDLAEVPEDLLELLSDGEHARAERLARPRDRALWARSRGVLRALLGRYLQTDPHELGIAPGDRGKPTLDPETVGTRFAGHWGRFGFNLSHSGETALYALSTAGSVGIDVEVARRPTDMVAVAERAFGQAEAARLKRLDPETREHEFLRAWVRHEAALKCLGTGIGGSASGEPESTPWQAELDMPRRAAAAVALSAPPRYVRCWEWTDWSQVGAGPSPSPASRSLRRSPG